MIDDRAEQVALVSEIILGVFLSGDVARDAEGADDVSVLVAPRELGGGAPENRAVEHGEALALRDHGFAGFDDVLFVAESAFGVFAGEEIEVGFAHAFLRGLPKRARVGDVVAHDPALEVLEVNVIRQRIHQHPQDRRIQGGAGGQGGRGGRSRRGVGHGKQSPPARDRRRKQADRKGRSAV
ncbi:MAG: hypothetical protein NVV63_13550 [Opitutus sp.]|nr:hypothetical protein [Opitutus sp.]